MTELNNIKGLSKLIELENFHINLRETESFRTFSCVRGESSYYHYNCDGFDDVGFGCGYRTTQTICSWLKLQIIKENRLYNLNLKVVEVPTILEMQKILVDCGDKSAKFEGSRGWIGCFESSIIIDYLYDVPCKILHSSPDSLENNLHSIDNHFEQFSSPIMMGGDLDNGSKGVLGTAKDSENSYLLIVNPHLKVKIDDKRDLIKDEWISWRSDSSFEKDSFYNFCMPQKKSI